FTRSSAYRRLHSFPTRRSSDLDVGEEAPVLLGLDPVRRLAEEVLGVGVLPLSDEVGVVVPALIEAEAIGDVAVGDERAGREAVRDRKSTRLNSSHVKISYAVFC